MSQPLRVPEKGKKTVSAACAGQSHRSAALEAKVLCAVKTICALFEGKKKFFLVPGSVNFLDYSSILLPNINVLLPLHVNC
jgi:hypothetical protein